MGVMGEVDASNDRNLKPQQFDDGAPGLSEFAFRVGDATDTAVPERVENGNGTSLLRAHVDESPKKMPPASPESGGRVTARLSETEATQPEISKHVVAESESKIPSPVLASSAPQRKVLSSNPSFKSLVTLLGEPVKVRSPASMESRDANGKVPNDQNAEVMGHQNGDSSAREKLLLSTPSGKRLSGILSRVSAKIAAQGADSATKTPELVNSAVSVNVLVEKFSAGARVVSPHPGPKNLTSPRRVMADLSRSPIPRQLQELHPVTPGAISSPRRGVPVHRSVSPVPPRSWKDSVFGDVPKDRRPSFSKSGPTTTPPPRFLTPTQAAASKTVANPSSKSLQFTTAFGITTPLKATTPTMKKTTAATVTKPTHAVTKPAGFNFRTNERAERRRDFNSKLEARHQVKETEKRRAELKALEEKESQLRQLRKSLTYKANPVPRFYQEPAPAPAELRKSVPTRAKSPNFTLLRRRDSCPASTTLGELNRTSPLRSSRSSVRCEIAKAMVPKPKQPFRPV